MTCSLIMILTIGRIVIHSEEDINGVFVGIRTVHIILPHSVEIHCQRVTSLYICDVLFQEETNLSEKIFQDVRKTKIFPIS